MRSLIFFLLLACTLGAQAQSGSSPAPANSQTPDSTSPPSAKQATPPPNSAPPRSDRVNASALGDAAGESSSQDTQIDLSPPPGDDKAHPHSTDGADSDSDVAEFHPFDPHRAAKDIEVGDYYFKRKNYVGAESRYREALEYKENDATATFKLAVCLEKMSRSDEALEQYENYLKVLPSGSEAAEVKKAIARLKGPAGHAAPSK